MTTFEQAIAKALVPHISAWDNRGTIDEMRLYTWHDVESLAAYLASHIAVAIRASHPYQDGADTTVDPVRCRHCHAALTVLKDE